ncbi:MAG: nicotinamide mononucleotide transporter [Clostridia bacterium]|nr:nicotinamide mononucleotide transporter [Clostridia bacterium]
MKRIISYFTKAELILWTSSVVLILTSFFISQESGILGLVASLIGVTALILCAKGNPIGQVFMIVFCCMYTYISYTFSYYGEMITYACMSLPMAVVALASWLRHPFKGNKSEVSVNRLRGREYIITAVLTVAVTIAFYFILKAFDTANLIVSTFSVTTSFSAAYLMFRRSPYYALLYAANDIVLIVLWTLAAMKDISYVSVIICFVAFLANDIYGFVSWSKMEKRQNM